MVVRAKQGQQGRVRGRRTGAQVGSGSTPGTPTGGGPAFSADFTALSSMPSGVLLSRATTGTRFNSSGVLVTEAIDAPRFDYAWDGSAWVGKGLLVEEQRTNLIPTSNPLTNAAWTSNAGATKAASGNNSPDGTTNATTVTPAAALGSFIYQGFTCSSTGTYTASILARVTSGTGLAYLSLQDAGAGSTTSVACSLTTTWTRFQVSRTCTSGNTPFLLIGNSYANSDASASFEAFGGQIESGAFATSYIPTTTVAVTRSADIVSSTDATALAAKAWLVEIGEGQQSNPATLLGINSSVGLGKTSGNALTTGIGGTQTSGNTGTWSGTNRGGIAWDSTPRVSIALDGGTVVTAANTPVTPTTLYFGDTGGSSSFMTAHLRMIAGYTSLDDSTLVSKSVVGAAF